MCVWTLECPLDTFKNHLASNAVVGNLWCQYVVSTKIMRAESHISGTMVTLNSVVALVGIWCFIHSKKMTFVGWWYAVKLLKYVVLHSMICNR